MFILWCLYKDMIDTSTSSDSSLINIVCGYGRTEPGFEQLYQYSIIFSDSI